MMTIEDIRQDRKSRRSQFVRAWHENSRFEHLLDSYCRCFQTVGEIAELLRQSWCNKVKDDNGKSVWFDLLSRKDQYVVVNHFVADRSRWDCAIGSDDGREVRVYRFVKG